VVIQGATGTMAFIPQLRSKDERAGFFLFDVFSIWLDCE